LKKAAHGQFMKEIGIYRKAFPRISETFIKEQALNLSRYNPTFILCTLLNQIPFQNNSISQGDIFKIKQASYLLTRSPSFFSHLDSFGNLALIHAHFGPDGVYAMALAEKLKIPFIVTFHGYDITIYRTAIWRTGPLLYYQLLWYEEELKKKASAFIAVSDFIRNQLLDKGYPEKKIIQHYIGVDTAKFSPSSDKSNERYIFCVGSHKQKKGIDTLLRAFARIAKKYPNVSLIQVGSGSMTSELHTLAKVLGINNRVRFLGGQPHETVVNLMRGAEIFCLPSQTAKNGDSEALGIVFNEASACGVPIVSTKHGGIPEAVLDGETGFLVPERDDVALAEKLDTLLSDRALAKKMGQRGREFVCEMFDIRKQTVKLEAIYDSLTH
jgi:glycosyltransferase involved in cell wall biosynthesis